MRRKDRREALTQAIHRQGDPREEAAAAAAATTKEKEERDGAAGALVDAGAAAPCIDLAPARLEPPQTSKASFYETGQSKTERTSKTRSASARPEQTGKPEADRESEADHKGRERLKPPRAR